jgi:hypothetical protein
VWNGRKEIKEKFPFKLVLQIIFEIFNSMEKYLRIAKSSAYHHSKKFSF